MNIRTRFIFVFTSILVIAFSGFLINVWSLFSVRKNLVSLHESRLKGIDLLVEADRDAYQSSLAVSKLFHRIRSGEETDKSLRNDVLSNQKQVEDRFRLFQASWKLGGSAMENHSDREWTEKFDATYPKWQSCTQKILSLVQQGRMNEGLVLYGGICNTHFSMMRESLDHLEEISLDDAKKEFDSSMESVFYQIIISFGTGGVISVISIILSIFLTRSITRPLYETVELTNQLAEGRLDIQIPDGGKDEFSHQYTSLRNFVNRVGSVVAEVQDSVIRLVAAAEQMTSATESFAEGSQDQASASEEITAAQWYYL